MIYGDLSRVELDLQAIYVKDVMSLGVIKWSRKKVKRYSRVLYFAEYLGHWMEMRLG